MIRTCCGRWSAICAGTTADRYQVISVDSGMSALESVKQLKLRNEVVALFLVAQRMPRMSGVEFLEKAIVLRGPAWHSSVPWIHP